MPEARTKIEFAEATQEAFEAFADEVAEHLPEAEMTYQDKPFIGPPYVRLRVSSKTNPWESYSLIVDAGQELCIGDNNVWVATPD